MPLPPLPPGVTLVKLGKAEAKDVLDTGAVVIDTDAVELELGDIEIIDEPAMEPAVVVLVGADSTGELLMPAAVAVLVGADSTAELLTAADVVVLRRAETEDEAGMDDALVALTPATDVVDERYPEVVTGKEEIEDKPGVEVENGQITTSDVLVIVTVVSGRV